MSRKTRRQKIDRDYSPIDQVHDVVHKFEQHRVLNPLNQSQTNALKSLRTNTLSILTGPPGTAKTLLSVYIGCELLQKRQIDKIYYVKPVVEVAGEAGLGFLPGDLNEKVEPHIGPLKDSLAVFLSKGKSDYLLSKKLIEFMPIDHLRGRSLERSMIIADEMQNATASSVLTLLTRAGNGTRIALLGDVVQRDLKSRYGKDGLSDAFLRLKDNSFVGCVDFGFEDIVRSDFVKSVITAYRDHYSGFNGKI
jgi:phosphate starvation-inducible PhoH-like protein